MFVVHFALIDVVFFSLAHNGLRLGVVADF
jgi:hypothetical protein